MDPLHSAQGTSLLLLPTSVLFLCCSACFTPKIVATSRSETLLSARSYGVISQKMITLVQASNGLLCGKQNKLFVYESVKLVRLGSSTCAGCIPTQEQGSQARQEECVKSVKSCNKEKQRKFNIGRKSQFVAQISAIELPPLLPHSNAQR